MEIERIKYKPKIKKIFDLNNGICFIRLRGSIYFLSSGKYDSIEMLREFTNYIKKTPIEFYNIIHDNFLKKTEQINRTNETKQIYTYPKLRIKRKKAHIKKLQAEIRAEKIKFKELKGGLKE